MITKLLLFYYLNIQYKNNSIKKSNTLDILINSTIYIIIYSPLCVDNRWVVILELVSYII